MNYREPRQLIVDGKPSGLWDFTNMRDNQVWPDGYCGKFLEAKPILNPDGTRNPDGFYNNQESADKHNSFKDKYHGGISHHNSPEEACDCYREYLLDRARFELFKEVSKYPATKHKCQIPDCTSYDCGFATVAHQTYILCDKHNNKETLQEHFYKKGELFSLMGSY